MRTRTILSVLTVMGLAGALVGCSGDVADSTSSLRQVDVQAMTSQTLYMMPEVSEIPFTAVELAERGTDESEAIPVRVEIFANIAVAWFAPDGVAVVGRDTIVALWDVVEIVPIADSTSSAGGDAPVTQPGYVVTDVLSDLDYANRFPSEGVYIQARPSAAEQAILDFADRLGSPEEIAALGELETYHPGCI